MLLLIFLPNLGMGASAEAGDVISTPGGICITINMRPVFKTTTEMKPAIAAVLDMRPAIDTTIDIGCQEC